MKLRHTPNTDHRPSGPTAPNDAAKRNPRLLITSTIARAAAVLALTAVLATSVSPAGEAEAWPWSSHVTVSGRLTCNGTVTGLNRPQVTIRLNNGETRSATANTLNRYSVSFRHIPQNGINGRVQITCHTVSGSKVHHRNIRVERPPVLENTTHNFTNVGR
jgi:hypothetical protein